MRLFVGITLPGVVMDRLMMLQGGIKNARWQGRDQLHLTLRFIGGVDGRQANEIHSALGSIRFPAFHIGLKGCGFFGKEQSPRQLWIGIDKPQPLHHLHDKIERALVAVGFESEQRKYKPHVTIARLKGRSAGLRDFLGAQHGFYTPEFSVDHFSLFSSHLGSGGATYRIEGNYPASDAMPPQDTIDVSDITTAEQDHMDQ